MTPQPLEVASALLTAAAPAPQPEGPLGWKKLSCKRNLPRHSTAAAFLFQKVNQKILVKKKKLQDLVWFYLSSRKKKKAKIVTNKKMFNSQVIQHSPVSGRPPRYLQNTAAAPGGNKHKILVLQLESRWSLWHSTVNIGVIENYKLPCNDFDNLLCSSSCERKKKTTTKQ